jgi:hypothetical protein
MPLLAANSLVQDWLHQHLLLLHQGKPILQDEIVQSAAPEAITPKEQREAIALLLVLPSNLLRVRKIGSLCGSKNAQ